MTLPNQYLSRVKTFLKKVITAEKKAEPEQKDVRKHDVTIRDLRPEKDANGGASKGGRDGGSAKRTGEVDFMKDIE